MLLGRQLEFRVYNACALQFYGAVEREGPVDRIPALISQRPLDPEASFRQLNARAFPLSTWRGALSAFLPDGEKELTPLLLHPNPDYS